ncbi:hypothetical protein N431DRAFT_28722 [Stipitochalara longipes BDJ]|nr:hypothetical protein N431DRAFT_28722 [Stipitochalara longipes BDJ]
MGAQSVPSISSILHASTAQNNVSQYLTPHCYTYAYAYACAWSLSDISRTPSVAILTPTNPTIASVGKSGSPICEKRIKYVEYIAN